MNDDGQPTAWERGVLERLLRDTLIEQRRARRWRMFSRLLTVILVLAVLGLLSTDVTVPQVTSRHTALGTMAAFEECRSRFAPCARSST